MNEYLRIYQGSGMRSCALDPERGFLAGAAPGADLLLPGGELSGRSLRLQRRGEGWQADCTGEVFLFGKRVSRTAVRSGDMFLLSKSRQILVQYIREDGQKTIPLSGETSVSLGRSQDADLRFSHPLVSGDHARLEKRGASFVIRDLNSTNGTYVNGERLTGERVLSPGDSVVIGPFRLEMGEGEVTVYGEGTAQAVTLRGSSMEPETPSAAHASSGKKPAVSGSDRPSSASASPSAPPAYPFFTRSPRLLTEVSSGEMEIEAAPAIGTKPEINWLSTLLPSLGGVAVMGVMIVAMGMSPISLALSGSMAVFGLVVTLVNYRRQTKHYEEAKESRSRRYEKYLEDCEAALKQTALKQQSAVLASHPSPAECLELVTERKPALWARTLSDRDFLSLRAGLGEEPLALDVRTPKLSPLAEEDEFSRKPGELAGAFRMVSGVPVFCDLIRFSGLGIVGRREETVSMAGTLAVQASAHHGYDELKLVVLFPEEEREQWEWMRWLPHVFDENRTVRYMASNRFEAETVFGALLPELKKRAAGKESWGQKQTPSPYYLFLVGDPSLLSGQISSYLLKNDRRLGTSCILLGNRLWELPGEVDLLLELAGGEGQLYAKEKAGERKRLRADALSLAECGRFARAMAPIRLPGGGGKEGLPLSVSFLKGWRAERVDRLDLKELWENSVCEETLAVPIGVRADGKSFYFDIHEKKHGPHGLVAGMSGSGKSELAQSWIASMALQFSPRDVNFILVDFKGTSLLQPFLTLPHLAGYISNLDTDIDRKLLALDGEMEHRQRLLDQYGARDILEYQRRRRRDPSMEEMPFLILVFDEFAEFKLQFPDFTRALDHVFRGGRSLGVYSVLMTQKPSGVVTEQMNANAAFRWCLQVQSDADSRELLGNTDAAYIRNPGRVYVKCEDGTYECLQAYYAGAPYLPERGAAGEAVPVSLVSLTGERRPLVPPARRAGGLRSQLEAVVERIVRHCERREIPPAKPIWQEKLPKEQELFSLLPGGKSWEAWPLRTKGLTPPTAFLGLVDDPAGQRQFPLVHNFWRDGHLALYGMTVSGKTTFLKSLLVSLACTHTPGQVQFYLAEFGGFGLRSMEAFPHVGAAAGNDEPETLGGLAKLLGEELDQRKKRFRKLGTGSLQAYLEAGGEGLPTWIVLADNLNLAGYEFPEIQEMFIRVGREGASFGIYLACTFAGLTGVSPQLTQNIKTILSLQLADRMDYGIFVGRVRGNIPESVPGRGLVRGPLEFQTAVPYSGLSDGKRAAALRGLAEGMTAAWKGEKPKGIRSAPEELPYGSLEGEPFLLGLSGKTLEPVNLPWTDTVSVLISAEEPEADGILELLLKEAVRLAGDSLFFFSESRTAEEPARTFHEAEDFDEEVFSLANTLRQRQEEKREWPEVVFSPIVVFIDGLKACLDCVKPDTVSRLEVFIRLGEGLGITILAADVPERVASCYYGGDILTATMREGPILLGGGVPEDHRITDTIALKKKHPDALSTGELIFVRGQEFESLRRLEVQRGGDTHGNL